MLILCKALTLVVVLLIVLTLVGTHICMHLSKIIPPNLPPMCTPVGALTPSWGFWPPYMHTHSQAFALCWFPHSCLCVYLVGRAPARSKLTVMLSPRFPSCAIPTPSLLCLRVPHCSLLSTRFHTRVCTPCHAAHACVLRVLWCLHCCHCGTL